jgi:hypothetical protein
MDFSLQTALFPEFDSASNRSEYLGIKAADAYG